MKAPIHLIRWTALLISMVLVEWTTSAQAQVVPDATLGNGRNSAITIEGNRTNITGGLQRNSALFHSFDQFSVGTNSQVYFANPAGIRNIFSRVTGGNISNIDGVLGVTGSANLFFMNPNGIVFGPNARLDVAGSFTATTANAVEFADSQRFAATGDRAVPLVDVNVPIGLQIGKNAPAMLTSQGNLAVGAGQNLSLVGGKTVNNGSLTAPGGTVQVLGNQVALQDRSRIEVSSPTGGGTVLVGGDYQGKGALVNAQTTTVASGSVINADALVNGNGGKVIVWADGDTRFNGTISAQGGVQGGNGGFVETSGKQNLGIGNAAVVNTFAPLGKAGTWLLDPASITIVANGDPRINTNTVDEANNYVTPDATTATSFIAANNIFNASSPTNIGLSASNFITVEAPINAGTVSSGLTFTASTLNLNANVTTLGSQTYNGAVTIGTPTATLTTSNDPVTFTNTVNSAANAENTASANNSLTIAAGTGTINFTNAVGDGTNGTLGNLTTTSSTIQLNTTNVTNNLNVTASGAITQAGDLTVGNITTLVTGANNITLNGTNNLNTVQITSGGNVILNNDSALNLGTSNITGTLGVTANGTITQSGNLTVGATTTLAAGTNDITLAGTNNFNTVQISDGGNVTLNDINTLNLGTTTPSTVSGNLNVKANTINVPNGTSVSSTGGNIALNGTTAVNNSGSLTASGRIISILGGQIALNGGSVVNVSGPTGGSVQINGSQVGIAATARVNADANPAATGSGGTIMVAVPNPLNAVINRTTTNITAAGSPPGTITLPQAANLPTFPTVADPNTSPFNNITIVDGNGQSIITALQGSINSFLLPFLQNDPILYQFYAGTLFQNFQIPQTALEGTTLSVFSSSLTGQNIVLAARNNITIQNLTNQGITPNQLTLTPPGATGSIQFAAGANTAPSGGGVFTMNQGDTIQTNGRSIQIRASNPSGIGNSLTIGGINASSLTGVGGDIGLTAANGNIVIGNGINPALISSDSVGNTSAQLPPNRSFSRIQVEAAVGFINLNNVQVQANSNTGFAGKVSINAANTITATNQTTVNANGQAGDITIGSILSSSTPPGLRPNDISIFDTRLSAENNFASLSGVGFLTAGAIRLGANNRVQVTKSTISSSTSANATAGAVEIQTASNSSGSISLSNSILKSEASGSGAAGAINLIDANTIALTKTTIFNTVVDGTGGTTTINGGTIAISDGTSIQADTTGAGKAGNIGITTTATNPTATTAALTIDKSSVTAKTTPPTTRGAGNSFNSGSAGTVSLKATNGGDVAIKNDSIVSSSASGSDSGNGGTIDVSGQNLSLLNGAVIQARSTGKGAPGSIAIDVPNTITVSGTSSSGQISEISTFSGASVVPSTSSTDPNAPPPGDIRINQSDSSVKNLNLSDRGRINASTQSTNANFKGGNIQVYTDNLNISSGGQIVASSLDDGGLSTPQASAGSINVVSNNIDASGSQLSFNADPSFRSMIFVKPIGNVTNNGTLLSTRGGDLVSTLAPALGLATGDPLLSNASNGSGVQLSALGNVSGTISFDSTFLTNEGGANPLFNDSSFVTTSGGSRTPLANVNTGSFVATPGAEFSRKTVGSPTQTLAVSPGSTVNIGVVNVGDSSVDSGLRLSNLRLNSALVQVLVSSPDINPNETFTSGIFAKAEGTGNAGSVNISGTTATSRVALSDRAQISTSTDRGGSSTVPSNISIQGVNNLTIQGVNNLTTSSNSSISASTNSGVAGNVQVLVNQGTNPSVNLTSNSSIEATAKTGGTAGSVSITTPTLNLADKASVAVSSNGSGSAGEVAITAQTVNLTDQAQIAATTDAGGASSPANINLTAQNVTVNSSSQIVASTNSGVGGNVNLKGLNTLQMNNGQVIASATTGRAGNLEVDATKAVNLNNGSRLSVEANGPKGVAGNVTVISPEISLVGGTGRSEIRTSAKGDGAKAGNVTLNTAGGNITLQKSDVIASSEKGTSGEINITARRANLNNGTIKAEIGQSIPGVSTGGINLDVSFRMTLENESEISTLGTNGANGGNIRIMGVRYLLGERPTGPDGSDIIGRADGGGKGGTVTIDRITLVNGFRFRKAENGNGTNDIDTNGQLNNFSTDADIVGRGLSTPLIVFNDVSQIVRSACEAVGAKAVTNSELKIASQGGVPLSPTTALPAQNPSSDWVTLEFSPQVPIGLKNTDGTTITTLEPGKHYQLPATCVRSWQQPQQSQLPIPPTPKTTTLTKPKT